jgi:NADH-quinone oxidoreductase subunit D
VYSLAVERLLDLELPRAATWIRMLMVELNRMSSHLLFQAPTAWTSARSR